MALMRHGMIRFFEMMNVDAKWFVMTSSQNVFAITKRKFHNVLQGQSNDFLSSDERGLYEAWCARNAEKWLQIFSQSDFIVLDDFQVPCICYSVGCRNDSNDFEDEKDGMQINFSLPYSNTN